MQTGRFFYYLGKSCPFDEWYVNVTRDWYPEGCIKNKAGYTETKPTSWKQINKQWIDGINETTYNTYVSNTITYINNTYGWTVEQVNFNPQDFTQMIYSPHITFKILLDDDTEKTIIMSNDKFNSSIINI